MRLFMVFKMEKHLGTFSLLSSPNHFLNEFEVKNGASLYIYNT